MSIFKRYWWMLLVMIPVGMMVGLRIAEVVTFVMPKKHESFATIEIQPRERDIDDPIPPALSLGTELELIKSSRSLSKVIDSLVLIKLWAVDEQTALRILKKIVQVKNIKGTNLVEISVRHTSGENARNIAVEVVRAYKKYKSEQHDEFIRKRMLELRRAVREQEDRVEERRKIRIIILRKKGDGGWADPLDKEDFDDATRIHEMEYSLLERLRFKLITEEVAPRGPNVTVLIHQDPVIADKPSSPNVMQNRVAGAFGGLLFSPFLALPLMWWMNRRSSSAVQADGGC